MTVMPDLDPRRKELKETWKYLTNEIANFRGKKIREAGLSFHNLMIMNHLFLNPEANQSELADLMSVSKPTVSSIVDTLVRKGLVTREIPDSDRRKTTLRLTEAGENLVRSIREEAVASFSKMLDQLSDEEVDSLNSILKKIRSYLENIETH
ncbi:MAG: MarR family transcriptional regulator [Candidatus Thermoplasmatota archaeon]|jgi:DNA-binding MarR family transcriptional regulator|nr:MarR family transcriptional regulator [Candidatus Thermoplasmatota archaeon]